ncbi:hypothetical protein PFICI_11886 [Pestalotiopsis fici W106-1]|uniref:DUF7580 domain-containing protein n=1 Tax=Pestalotiopsis fici (strain W106-1 / CGMCC3.15140) TaxID=1229662 RepID=W3WRN4_PESFW|nr:uncharacterized protein PFICI_11886 [Pestalotiopsis fici W106-1]ETS76499.1 hypothetical protein PFICI_11886 [Pestalotiopsis fici W106-1]
MAEILGIASAAIGLVPIVVEVVKGFGTLCKAMKVAKACAKQLKDLDVNLRTQEQIFINECELLLRPSMASTQSLQEMTRDFDNPTYHDGALEIRIQSRMSQSYEQSIEIIKAIRLSQQLLQSELSTFAIVREEKQVHESLRATFKRLKTRLEVGFNLSSYEKQLDQIRRHNCNLQAIRRQLDDLHTAKPFKHATPLPNRPSLPSWISPVRELSKDAYFALSSAFSCQDDKHTDHYTALETSTRSPGQKSSRLEVAIVYCHGTDIEDHTFLRLILQSCLPHPEWVSKTGTAHVPKSTRRVQFAEPEPERHSTESCPVPPEQRNLISLSAVDNACAYLESTMRYSTRQHTDYLAYLYQESPCERSFYITRHTDGYSPDSYHRRKSLQDLFKNAPATRVTMPGQLRLAIQLVYAVLQSHSTPWLRELWTTSDLLFETTGPNHQNLDLDLFLRSRLLSHNDTDSTTTTLERRVHRDKGKSIPSDRTDGYGRDNYDICNMTLFSLGIALLEIGHWAPMSQMRLNGDRDDIATALRVAQENIGLGKKYGRIVRKCMQCEFGYGHDLGKVELQSAIYSDIVCPLQELVDRLDGP